VQLVAPIIAAKFRTWPLQRIITEYNEQTVLIRPLAAANSDERIPVG
jgi:hypothetical protein